MKLEMSFLDELPWERIEQNKKTWRKVWRGEPVGRPLVSVSRFRNPIEPITVSTRDFLKDDRLNLSFQLKELANRVIGEDDYVPTISTYMGTTVLASAFGCSTVWPEHQQPWAEPLVRRPVEIASLRRPRADGGLLGRVLERTEWLMEVSQGRLPIRVTDIQGPLDTAYLIWHNEEFLVAMYEAPEAVHALLQMVTDLIIDFVRKQRSIAKHFVPLNFPYELYSDSDGPLGISEDVVVTLGGDLYEEFVLPYHQQLADAFGGLFIHSCGRWTHIIDRARKIDGLKGVDFGVTETGYSEIEELMAGRYLLSARIGLNFGPCRYPNELVYVEDIVGKTGADTNVCIYITGKVPDPINPADPHDYRPVEGKTDLDPRLESTLRQIRSVDVRRES
jgi:hypothetical protein